MNNQLNYWKTSKFVGNLLQNHLAAILFVTLVEKRDYLSSLDELDEDGGFCLLSDEIEKSLFITKEMRQKLTKCLEEADLLKVKKKGLPSKNYYYIQDESIPQE